MRFQLARGRGTSLILPFKQISIKREIQSDCRANLRASIIRCYRYMNNNIMLPPSGVIISFDVSVLHKISPLLSQPSFIDTL